MNVIMLIYAFIVTLLLIRIVVIVIKGYYS